MPVFRVEKNSNYTTMCNYHLRDQGLSLKGKGLLSMLLSLPDTWNYSVRGLSSITPDGVDGVLTALKELERLGYLERNQQRESIIIILLKKNTFQHLSEFAVILCGNVILVNKEDGTYINKFDV